MLPAHREAELEGIIKLADPTAYVVAEQYLGYRYVDMALAIKEKFSCLKHLLLMGTVDKVYRTYWNCSVETCSFRKWMVTRPQFYSYPVGQLVCQS